MHSVFCCSNFDGKGNEILINLDKVIYAEPNYGLVRIRMVDNVELEIPGKYWEPIKKQLIGTSVSVIAN